MDYYNYIISYKNNDKELVNKYFDKVAKDTRFNEIIAECYMDPAIQEVMTLEELKMIMYMYYVIAMLELYENQKQYATRIQIKCIMNKIQLENPEDANVLYRILPKMITEFTHKFTHTHDFKNIYTNDRLNAIINYVYKRISEFVYECLM